MSTPILCAFDIEATGLDVTKAEPFELGWVIKAAGDRRALSIQSHYINVVDILTEVLSLTHMTHAHLRGAAHLSKVAAVMAEDMAFFGVDYLVSHNGTNYDLPVLLKYPEFAFLRTYGALDTCEDVVYPAGCKSRNLTYLAAYHGFINPFPHSAIFDAMTTAKILDEYPFEDVIARKALPWVVIRALVKAPFHDPKPAGQKETDLAKAQGFKWQEVGGQMFDKCWVKRVKEDEVSGEQLRCPFPIRVIQNAQVKTDEVPTANTGADPNISTANGG
jgi:DNA polymerase-3 subunit epsilon